MPKLKLNARPMTWTSKRRGKVPKYKYSTMQEISNNETFDNSSFYYVYGIVADFKEATKSKGSDYFSLVFLVDDTSQVPLRIRLFNRDPNFLPKVDIGDIIRLHRLKAYRYDEVVLNTVKGWSWVLWRHKDDILTSEKASSDSYTLTSSDREMVDKLREWFKDHSGAISGGSQKFKRIQEINHNDHFSLVCQVLDFKEVSSTHIVLKVWDGTNPNITFHHFLESEDFNYENVPEEYVVDVSIYDDHVSCWHDLHIDKGEYIHFRNLHAWPNPQSKENHTEKNCSELSLHPGKALGRGVEIAYENEYLNIVKSDIDVAKAFCDPNNDFSQSSRHDDCPGPSVRSSEENKPQNGVSSELINIETNTDSDDDDNNVKQSCLSENKVSQSLLLTGFIVEERNTQSSISSTNSSQVMRCLQESLTVVFGEGVGLKLTDLNNVINFEVPINTSKYFRVRVQVESCVAKNGTNVVHCCPITSIAFPTNNTGEPLNFVEGEVRSFVEMWRKVRGLDSQDNANTPPERNDLNSQVFSQWDLPTSQGTNPVIIKSYECKKDGSRWESMETENHVIRKRKLNGKKFKILYLLKVEDYSKEQLLKYSSKYNRVIRSIPLDILLSSKPPAVGIQSEVFYYSCPAFAISPRLPSLQDEAESFIEERISLTMGSPCLVPRFILKLTLIDDKSKIENVTLMGKRAKIRRKFWTFKRRTILSSWFMVQFFCDTTTQHYLANKVVADSVNACIDKIIKAPVMLECVLEKKSRKRRDEANTTPYYIYEICDTSLKC